MNTFIYLIIALITVSSPATDISSNAFNGIEMTWSIASNAARALLEELVANQEVEESEVVEVEIAEVEPVQESQGYTDADVAYWNGLAMEYGFQVYNGFGDFNQFVESAQQLVYNAQTYGNPYYEDQGLQTFYEDENGVLIENPVYENRWGPEDDQTNQVEANDGW